MFKNLTLKSKFYNLKSLFLIISLVSLFSCSTNQEYPASWVRLSSNDSISYKSFSFEVSSEFVKNNKSKIDPKNPLMSKAESRLLKNLLRKNNYCINNKDELSFQVISRQGEIHDVTLDEKFKKQYHARSLAPVTYFVKCL